MRSTNEYIRLLAHDRLVMVRRLYNMSGLPIPSGDEASDHATMSTLNRLDPKVLFAPGIEGWRGSRFAWSRDTE